MKVWQFSAIVSAAVILGCGGYGAYVPDSTAGSGTPLVCADLSIDSASSFSVTQGDTAEELITVYNGNVYAVQSRSPGDATVTLTISGLPNFVTGTFDPSQLTIPLDGYESSTLDLDATGALSGSAYNVTITATQAGCTPVTRTVPLDVPSGGS